MIVSYPDIFIKKIFCFFSFLNFWIWDRQHQISFLCFCQLFISIPQLQEQKVFFAINMLIFWVVRSCGQLFLPKKRIILALLMILSLIHLVTIRDGKCCLVNLWSDHQSKKYIDGFPSTKYEVVNYIVLSEYKKYVSLF